MLTLSDELNKWLASEDFKELQQIQSGDLNPALENKSWTFLRNRLQLLLGMYSTTLEEDAKLLEQEGKANIYTNKRLAIRMRTTEKKILKAVIEYAEERILKD